MTYKELLKEGVMYLQAREIDEARQKAEILLFYTKNWSKTDYILHMGEEAGEDVKGTFRGFLKLSGEHVPVQHITHSAPFYGRNFYVDENVLVPRFDTEVLVHEALKEMKRCPKEEKEISVLDLCTGSGCIGVTLFSELKRAGIKARITASDISPEALDIAEKNAKTMGAEVSFIKSDLFEALFGEYDFIVSNPPYIKEAEIKELSAEVRNYDPHIALSGGEDGLSFYRRIVKEAPRYLKKGGRILVEIGEDEGREVSGLFSENGFDEVRIVKDMAGLDRVVSARRKEENV